MKGGALISSPKPVERLKNLLPAIRASHERDAVARRNRPNYTEICARLDTLTPREREVSSHVIAGKLNKQIARDLGITEATVKMHRPG